MGTAAVACYLPAKVQQGTAKCFSQRSCSQSAHSNGWFRDGFEWFWAVQGVTAAAVPVVHMSMGSMACSSSLNSARSSPLAAVAGAGRQAMAAATAPQRASRFRSCTFRWTSPFRWTSLCGRVDRSSVRWCQQLQPARQLPQASAQRAVGRPWHHTHYPLTRCFSTCQHQHSRSGSRA